MALLWRVASGAAARRLGRPSVATAIHGRRASSTTSSSGTETTSKGGEVISVLLRLGVFVGAAAYTALKINEKDFVLIREEMQKKADEKDISSLREEMRRLQNTNAGLTRSIILLQEEQGSGKRPEQVIATDDILVNNPAVTEAAVSSRAGR